MVYIRTQSPPQELAAKYEQEEMDDYEFMSPSLFHQRRCYERGEIIWELSHELSQLRFNYEDVCKRLQKYEPDFVPPVETEYDPEFRMV